MVIVKNLELTGRKCATAEICGGVIIFTADGAVVDLSYDEATALCEILNEKKALDGINV